MQQPHPKPSKATDTTRLAPGTHPARPQVEQAQEELERRQAAAEAAAEELAARERSLRRQEDGLEGLKVGRAAGLAGLRESRPASCERLLSAGHASA